ncbi:hypothetical protein KNW02_03615 [Paracoccus sp. XHP0099]|uniref:Uncharacterized protein n=1 Tax=Paracoccus marinaquae TaxID=2841926 RepID=A0ABS6AFD5_9RHOB|nr:hypothetical protein [Paracoccus marinaquae]
MHPGGTEPADEAVLSDQGRLDPVIDRVFHFDRIGEVNRCLEPYRAGGKLVPGM